MLEIATVQMGTIRLKHVFREYAKKKLKEMHSTRVLFGDNYT